MTSDLEGDTERQRVIALFQEAEDQGTIIRIWWRDDDAEDSTPALDRLLALAERFELPLTLAVVPSGATVDLAKRVAREPKVRVLQHGWSHRNHAPEGEKKMELGDHRPLETIVRELNEGRVRLARLFSGQFLPVLVPPWNRVSIGVAEARTEAGLVGLSMSGPAGKAPHQINVHLDIFEWRPFRRPITLAVGFTRLAAEIERRLAGDPEPIGIMTHHLVHEEESWRMLEKLFALLGNSRAVAWPRAEELFGLIQGGRPDSFAG
jgi:peptidoglycan/xylan/chitin deacetylase (PgdA/CDA1 family)